MTDEKWDWIPGYEGYYEASTKGRIRSVDRDVLVRHPDKHYTRKTRGKIIKGQVLPNGYRQLQLKRDGDYERFYVHHLVLMTHGPEAASGESQCNHVNGIKTDNRLQNLEWCSPSENVQHALQSGIGNSIVTAKDVREIRKRYNSEGIYQKELADEYGITQTAVSAIVRRETWAHVD